ncbi:putative kinesin heavy chain [Neospora caninum Liverpool]|uniref:Putative kinesin heavy chain n=1 Tax=Neospora caninum (strain Liverpool) TaxID=572307 RepID=F0VIR1_NEOCL|nr:putative kinesin heavy chain [Neospora caninum Liverpool]CBZ53622.1 putative kinesin heavy chain [Neospora caninum Liverpool]|eukprot:XP_003883654.1 putative kinesin heavy chain [Neospora caninum Liverpool]
MDGKGKDSSGPALLDGRNMDDLVGLEDNKEESIRVCTRMRPLFPKEVEARHVKAWKVDRNTLDLVVEPPSQLEMEESRYAAAGKSVAGTMKKAVEKTQGQKDIIQRHFVFDRCFDDNTHNAEVFDYVAKDIVLDCFKGINGCVFAYGQTGSGKTHSIMGVADDPGILPRSLAEFFDCVTDPSLLKEEEREMKRQQGEEGESNGKEDRDEAESENENTEYLMRVSYVEIYLERVNDLLQESPKGGAVENLEVKEDPKRGFVVVGLHEETVATMEEAMSLIAKAEQRRHFARTNFNETSSRSHVVFSITLESTRTFEDGSNVSRRGELKIVDLAGNEKAGRASEGVENAKLVMEEGKAINKSLFLLSEVISKLSKQAQLQAEGKQKKGDKEVYIPWRDSKLTRLLQKALGGNSRASVLVAVHPSNMYLDTSFSTLRFALKCKSIKKKVSANFFSPEQSLIAQQKKLILRLQSQLKALAGAGLFDHLPQRAAQSPENNEEVQQLKFPDAGPLASFWMFLFQVDLEKKINKFQQFIMKATKPSQGISGFEGFRRLDTLAAAKQNLRTIDKLNSGDIYSGDGAGVSLTKAFGFLARKQASRLSRGGTDSESYGSLSLGHLDTIEPAIDATVQELEDIDDRYEEAASSSGEEGEEGGLSESEARMKNVDWDVDAEEAPDRSPARVRLALSDEESCEEKARKDDSAPSSRGVSPSPERTEKAASSAEAAKNEVHHATGKKGEGKVKATVRIVDDVVQVEDVDQASSPSRVSFAGEKKKAAGEGMKKSALKKRSESPEGIEEAGAELARGVSVAKPSPKSALKNPKKKVSKKKIGKSKPSTEVSEKVDKADGEASAASEGLVDEGEEDFDDSEEKEQLKEDKMKMEGKVVRLRSEKKVLLEKLKKAKALGLEAVSRLTFRFKTEHESVKKLQQRVQDLNLQARYSSAILNKLGLSVLFTASVPAVENRPNMKLQSSSASLPEIDDDEQLTDAQKKLFERTTRFADFIKAFQEQGMLPADKMAAAGRGFSGELAADYFDFSSSSDAFKGLMFPDIDQVKPLAYAMINDVLARLMVMQAQASRGLVDDDTAVAEHSRLLENTLSIMRGEGIPTARSTPSEHAEDKQTLEQVEEVLGLVPSAKVPREDGAPVLESKISEADEVELQTNEEKRQRIAESVLSLLTPWEQNMLAMLYEQQEMRRALGELRDHFFNKLREMQLRFKRAMLERVEFSDHCERLLGALMDFKAELQRRQEKKTVEEDTNAKFGKLMSKIEEISIQLSERNVDYRLLTSEYKELMKRNDSLRNLVDKLKVEKATLLLAPQSLPHFEEINSSTADSTLRSLGYDVCILQRYGSRLLVEVEEARAAEAELRKLNAKLYTELAAANDCVNDLKTHINLANTVHTRTVSGLKTQLVDLQDELTEKNAHIDELQDELAALRERVAALESAQRGPAEEAAQLQSQLSSGSTITKGSNSMQGKEAVTSDKEEARSASDSDAHGRDEKKKKAKKGDGAKAKSKTKAAGGKKTRKPAAPTSLQVAAVGRAAPVLVCGAPSFASRQGFAFFPRFPREWQRLLPVAAKSVTPFSRSISLALGPWPLGFFSFRPIQPSACLRRVRAPCTIPFTCPATVRAAERGPRASATLPPVHLLAFRFFHALCGFPASFCLPGTASASPSRSATAARSASSRQASPAARGRVGNPAPAAPTPATAKTAKARPAGTRAVPGTLTAKKAASPASPSHVDRDSGARAEPAKPKAAEKPAVAAPVSAPSSPANVKAPPSPAAPAPAPQTQAAEPVPPAPVVTVAKAPAFTGDPRDKGFGNMAAALVRRRPAAS